MSRHGEPTTGWNSLNFAWVKENDKYYGDWENIDIIIYAVCFVDIKYTHCNI